ncbi:MAG: urease subunit beta [Ferruginibacter sp.]
MAAVAINAPTRQMDAGNNLNLILLFPLRFIPTLNIRQLKSTKNNLKTLNNMIPGEYILAFENIECNTGRETVQLTVVNMGDRPVQVGSHYHFFEVNKQMEFDREKSFGMRLNIAAGTAVRFEPGEQKEVELVVFGGNKKIVGFNNLVDGYINDENKAAALIKVAQYNFKNKF